MVTREINNYGQPIVDSAGDAVAGLLLIFTLVDKGYNPTAVFDVVTGEYIQPMRLTVTTDINGEFKIDLWPTSRGASACQWLCTMRWPGSIDEFFAAPVVSDNAPLKFFDWKQSAYEITSAETSAFALHVQNSSIHGGGGGGGSTVISGVTAATGELIAPTIVDNGDGTFSIEWRIVGQSQAEADVILCTTGESIHAIVTAGGEGSYFVEWRVVA